MLGVFVRKQIKKVMFMLFLKQLILCYIVITWSTHLKRVTFY